MLTSDAPVDCATAQGDIRVLEAEKPHVAERILEGATAISPAGAVIGILTGTEGTKLEVAIGTYNEQIDACISEIKTTCGLSQAKEGTNVIRNIRTALSALALAAVLLLPGTALAEEAADRAVVVAEEITLTGKVVAIGKESRMIIVEGPTGRQVAMKAPKEGQNFDQISMGDTVTARYFDSVALAITIAPSE